MFGKESLPHLHELFSIIQADEGRRNVMLDTLVEEGSPLAVVKPSSLKKLW